MRLVKSLTMVSIFTIVSLVYVHQQVELVKLSYAIEHKEKKVKDILDRNDSLGYNIDNLESPLRLEQALLAKKIAVTFPRRANVVKVARLKYNSGREDRLRSAGVEKKFSFFGIMEFLSPRAEAQAKER